MKIITLISIILMTNFNLNGQIWRTYNVFSLNKIAIDKQGNKWFATNDGIFKFDNQNWVKFDTSSGLASNRICSILIDKYGNKWFGAYNFSNDSIAPVTKYDNEKWITYNAVDSPSGYGYSVVRDIAEDSAGNIWFATSSGVSMFDGIKWNYYHVNDGLPSNYIRCIAIDKFNNKWFGTQNGLSKFNGSSWTKYYTSDSASGISGNCILSLAFDKQNNLWAGGVYGLYKLQNSRLLNANSSIQTSVDAIAFDKNGVMWLGIQNGFVKYDGAWHTTITSANDGVESIAVDLNNDIWLGTYYWTVKYSSVPLIFNVSPQELKLDTLKGSKNYFVINSNTSWTININNNGCLCKKAANINSSINCSNVLLCNDWVILNKFSGSDTDTIWVSSVKNYGGYPRSVDVQISEFGLVTKNITISQGVTTNVLINQTSDINIYPNPVFDNLVIENNNGKPIDKLEIYSINGLLRSFSTKGTNKFEINMLKYEQGVYFIKIYINSAVILKKVIRLDY